MYKNRLGLENKWSCITVFLLLLAPICMNCYFMEHDTVALWFLANILVLFMFAVGLLGVASRIRYRWQRFITAAVLIIPYYLLQILEVGSFYFQGCSFNEKFFYHIDLENFWTALPAYPLLAAFLFALLLALNVALWRCCGSRVEIRIPAIVTVLMLGLGFFLSSPIVNLVHYMAPVFSLGMNADLSIGEIREVGLNPRAIMQDDWDILRGSKKNLLIIYLESLERIYTDESVFPGLTPEINNLTSRALFFENIYQTGGSGWTMGGIVSSQCGTPLLWENSLTGGNDIMASGFLGRAVCLGDILDRAGYFQEYLGGAKKSYGGKGLFLEQHGYDEVLGLDTLKNHLKRGESYGGWGLYDDSLFEIAASEYDRLVLSERPFNLTLLTVDTHHPVGRPSLSCKPYKNIKGNSILDAVHCTDQLLGRFLKKISASPAYDNTLIVIMSDHLAMRNDAEPLYPKGYDRKVLFMMLNAGRVGKIHKRATQLDIAPTILHALGIKTNVVFLAGRDILDEHYEPLNVSSGSIFEITKLVNSRYLSNPEFNLCAGKVLVKYANDNILRIGDRDIPLYNDGVPVTPKRFDEDMAVLAMFDGEKKLKYSAVMPASAVCSAIYMNDAESLLLIRPANGRKGVEVWGGNSACDVRLMGRFDVIEDVEVQSGECSFFSNVGLNSNDNENDLCKTIFMGKFCDEPLRVSEAKFDPTTGRLEIPKLLIMPFDIVRVVLMQRGEKLYVLNEYEHLGKVDEDLSSEKIYPWFRDGKLYIPIVKQDDGKSFSMEMRLVSRNPVRLELYRKGMSQLENPGNILGLKH